MNLIDRIAHSLAADPPHDLLPGDLIEAVQGFPTSPHGADPDEMPGVIHLSAGDYDDGRPMAGPDAHSDVINVPSDSWRKILAVITGDSSTLHKAG